MAQRIEDYALIGDTESAALVSSRGVIDWLCWPRFDSEACFAALLGDRSNGCWRLAPAAPILAWRRAYVGESLVLATEFETDEGAVRLLDFMPIRDERPNLVRVVEGVRGSVLMRLDCEPRFGYGDRPPWIRQQGRTVVFVSAPDAVVLHGDAALTTDHRGAHAVFEVQAGGRVAFELTWHPAHLAGAPPCDPCQALAATTRWWTSWAARCTYRGPWRELVLRSLITLKALTYAPSGGIVAAPTTSLPERMGGVRNWDYRYCWLRDATLTLLALVSAGYGDEAVAWRDWLLRVAKGDPSRVQVMYGLLGERWLQERELPWLRGFGGSRPVRVGNGAVQQMQLDVFGEIVDCLHQARVSGMPADEDAWDLERAWLSHLERVWREPDHGIWETRGPAQHFTHSKLMAWAAFDRAVKDAVRFRLPGPVEHWRRVANTIHADVLGNAYDQGRQAFTQAYGSRALDASLLQIPTIGFLPGSDPRVARTIRAIQRELSRDGFVVRYDSHRGEDGLPPGEGAFLACSFWLVDALVAMREAAEAAELFQRVASLANDVGLLAEEYDPAARQLLGNFPQAFSHVALVNSALNLSRLVGPAAQRVS